jgi:tRNA threonylcarbamoyl adenosine modification protein YeaZ
VLLALDTATPAVSVALHDGSAVRVRRRGAPGRRHAEVLTPLVAEVLAEAGVAGPSLDAVVVGVGPGAYTGLRVGLATAAALGLAFDVPVHGACTLDALAAQAGLPGEALVVTDARRRQVFWGRYVDGRRVTGPRVAAPHDVPGRGVPAVGGGALAHPDAFPRACGPEHPDAAWLAAGVLAGSIEVLPVEPVYLRQPDVTLAPRTERP